MGAESEKRKVYSPAVAFASNIIFRFTNLYGAAPNLYSFITKRGVTVSFYSASVTNFCYEFFPFFFQLVF